MKIIASILVMYFGLLMLQPFANMCNDAASIPPKECSIDKCCKNADHQKGTAPCKNAGACNADFCNPFVPCGISMVPCITRPGFNNPVLDLLKIKKPTVNEDITSAYLADCWRPPELS